MYAFGVHLIITVNIRISLFFQLLSTFQVKRDDIQHRTKEIDDELHLSDDI